MHLASHTSWETHDSGGHTMAVTSRNGSVSLITVSPSAPLRVTENDFRPDDPLIALRQEGERFLLASAGWDRFGVVGLSLTGQTQDVRRYQPPLQVTAFCVLPDGRRIFSGAAARTRNIFFYSYGGVASRAFLFVTSATGMPMPPAGSLGMVR